MALTTEQKTNITAIVQEAKKMGITNSFSLAAILSIVSKETGFKYKAESSYSTTDNARIRKIFSTRVAIYTESDLTTLKKNDAQFFDAVYGYKTKVGRDGGNTAPGDGFKYRGRGANQITFKNSYLKIGNQIGVDLISNPDLLNTPTVAARAAIQFFINTFKTVPRATLAKYNSTGINDFKSLPDSVGAFYHANAGFGHPTSKIEADVTGGLKKARESSNSFLDFVSQNKVEVVAGGGGLFFLGATGLVIWLVKRKNKKEKK